jgi:hypothetical protein
MDDTGGDLAELSTALASITTHKSGGRAENPEHSCLGFLASVIAVASRNIMMSLAIIPGSSTLGSASAHALQDLMRDSPGGEEKLLLDEILIYNVPVKRRCFPKEASKPPREALDEILSLAMSLYKSSPLTFSAFALFVLFPLLLLRPLPDGCQGSFAAATLSMRCNLLTEGQLITLLGEAQEAQTRSVAKQTKSNSIPTSTSSFSKTARVVILARAGTVGRACKIAFS